jgi:2-C-methyl-D-erythritol 4-phosphate cytidylyltransferase
MNVAIIAAAGLGTRMSGERPKQFLELAGIPIIFHTLKAFQQCEVVDEVVAVLADADIQHFLAQAEEYDLRKVVAAVPGGRTRAESVLNGLRSISEDRADIVAVHDGVRPFVTPDEIARTIDAARASGAAVLVSTPVDTMKEVENGFIKRTLDRSTLRNALTPQCFQYRLLRRAYDQIDVMDPRLTDEASLVERTGAPVAAVEGSARNFKITNPEDLLIAEQLFKMAQV